MQLSVLWPLLQSVDLVDELISAFLDQFSQPLGKILSVRNKIVYTMLQKRTGMTPGLLDDVLDAFICCKSCKALDEAQSYVSK